MKEADGHWLAGLVDGEGCFTLDVGIHSLLAIGNCIPVAPRNGKPSYRFAVQKKSELLQIAALFERFPLRTKKRRDFESWARALRTYVARLEGTERQLHTRHRFGAMKRFRVLPQDLFIEMVQLSDTIKNGRRYT